MSDGTTTPSPQPPGDPEPPATQPSRNKALIIGIVGVILAAIPIGWAVISWLFVDNTGAMYIAKADGACSKHRPALDALGPEPWQADHGVYTEYLQKRSRIVRAALKDWGAVKIPPHKQGEIGDAYFAADAAAREMEIAVDFGTIGNTQEANEHLEKASDYGVEAIRKARSAGLKVCPVGF